MYRITPEPAKRRVIVEFIDTYSDIDQAALARELRAAMLAAKGTGDHFDLISDFSSAGVMPQSATADGRSASEWAVANGLRRSANVTGSMISRMQLQRLTDAEHFQTFATRAEAEAWLASD